MNHSSKTIPRRDFLKSAGLATALKASTAAAQTPASPSIVDCQSRVFFPEVLDMMRFDPSKDH